MLGNKHCVNLRVVDAIVSGPTEAVRRRDLHPVALPELRNSLTNFLDDACHVLAKYDRPFLHEQTREVNHIVSRSQPRGLHLDKDFSRPRSIGRYGFQNRRSLFARGEECLVSAIPGMKMSAVLHRQ